MNYRPVVIAAAGCLAQGAQAHSFGEIYTLPLPFWLYGWGASATLILSFVLIGYFATGSAAAGPARQRDISEWKVFALARRLQILTLARFSALAVLGLCIATGLWGSQKVYDNFNMTWFWIIFLLGFAYLSALAGNLYAALNPWRLLADGAFRFFRLKREGWLRYPKCLAYWPALLLFVGLIWLELLATASPSSLAIALLAYTALNLAGALLIGRKDWFEYCECFSVFFRLLALLAPLEFDAERPRNPGLRAPFLEAAKQSPSHISLLLFVLFMLSSTAFDGLHETQFWRKIFWRDLYLGYLQFHTSENPLAAYPEMARLYAMWQQFWLVLSALIYLGIYWIFIALSRWISGSPLSTRALALRFGYTLLPIALVYHAAHYYTLLQSQGLKIIALASDPFGYGQNWFGTADWYQLSIVPNVNVVWHVQVILIVAGHIISVWLAHKVALDVFGSTRRAVFSQLPMLVLMVLFTVAGLWILSKPIGS